MKKPYRNSAGTGRAENNSMKTKKPTSAQPGSVAPLSLSFDAERPDARNYVIKRGERVVARLTGDEVIGLRDDTFYLHGE